MEKERERAPRGAKRTRKKVCAFCADRVEKIDYQRELTVAIKRARHIALLPYVSD